MWYRSQHTSALSWYIRFFSAIYVYMLYVYILILKSDLFLLFLNFSGLVVIIQAFLELFFGYLFLKLDWLTVKLCLTNLYVRVIVWKIEFWFVLLFFNFSDYVVIWKTLRNCFKAIRLLNLIIWVIKLKTLLFDPSLFWKILNLSFRIF